MFENSILLNILYSTLCESLYYYYSTVAMVFFTIVSVRKRDILKFNFIKDWFYKLGFKSGSHMRQISIVTDYS